MQSERVVACPDALSWPEGLTQGEAHALFLKAIGGDPKAINLSTLASTAEIPVSRMWSYANGESRWPADAWLATMRALGSIRRSRDGTLRISARPRTEAP